MMGDIEGVRLQEKKQTLSLHCYYLKSEDYIFTFQILVILEALQNYSVVATLRCCLLSRPCKRVKL